MFITEDLNRNLNDIINTFNKNNENLEFEIRFQQNNNFNFFSNLLHSLNLFRFINKSSEYNLDISIDNLRLSVNNNKEHIVDLCNNNFSNLYNDNFKNSYSLMEKSTIKNIDINDIYGFNNYPNNDLNIRFSLSKELSKEIDNTIINKFINETNKTIRFKNRFSFYNDLFRFDLTISNKLNTNNDINDNTVYEIELEYINKQSPLQSTVLFGYIKFIYSLMYNSNIPLNISTKDNIFKQYINLIGNNVNKNHFIGDEVRTFKLNNLDKKKKFNILNFDLEKTVYAVTDKADGSRFLMYISYPIPNIKDNVFFIDKFNHIYRPGIYTTNESLFNTIIDGEYIDYKNLFLAFDILFYNNKDIRKLHLINPDNESRLSILQSIDLNNDFKFIESKITFSIKEYLYNDNVFNNDTINPKTIFDHNITLWKDRYEDNNEIWKYNKINTTNLNYKLDGLIFTPINRQYYIWNKATINKERAYNLKWKPPTFNSIDFQVFFPNIDNIVEDNIEYKIIHILSSNQKKHINFTLKNTILNQYHLTTTIYHKDAHIIYIPVTNNSIVSLHDNKQIKSGNIVELIYNNESQKDYKFNWKIIRSRPDKKFANGIRTAIDVWNSIHENITDDFIYNDKYNNSNVKSFYNMELEFKNKPAPWIYHNKFKNYIINNLINSFDNKINVLEFGSGRGGDFPKFNKTGKVNNIVAIELFEEGGINIAKERYPNNKVLLKKIYNRKPINITTNLYYINADFTKLLYTKNNKLNKNFIQNTSDEYSNNFESWFSKLFKFDFISSQFALQFAFRNKTTINNFFNNISKSLSDNGIFFCTFPDGDSIFKQFKKEQFNSFTINSSMNNKLISTFKIKDSTLKLFNKHESLNDLPDDKKIGIKLEVETSSFRESSIHEYFVNKELLIEYAEKNGLTVSYNYNNFNLNDIISTTDGVGIWNSYPHYKNINNTLNMKDDPNAQFFSNLFSFLIFTKISAESSSN